MSYEGKFISVVPLKSMSHINESCHMKESCHIGDTIVASASVPPHLDYGVAMISRLLKIIGLFCRVQSLL